MGRYLTRIELHKAANDGEAYEQLHDEMRKLGFVKTIRSDEGITYQLPTAEYYSNHDGNSNTVMETAKIAAKKIGLKYSIIVANCVSISFDYLEVVKR